MARERVLDTHAEEKHHLWTHTHNYLGRILEAVRSINRGAPFWEADTIPLGPKEGKLLAKADAYRCSITITNQGANPAVVSPTKVASMAGQGSCALPAGTGRTFKATGDIYVYSDLGTVIDHQTERDHRFQE